MWAGALTWLDRYATRHLMPWAHFGPHHLIHVAAVFRPQTGPTLGGTLVALWTYPASPFISGLVVLFCAWRLRSLLPIELWVAANAIELAGKLIVRRPRIGVSGFADSFPSGHTVRAFVTAAIIGWVWRRAGWAALAWAVGVAIALVAIGDHVPTDVIGGALLAGALAPLAGKYAQRFSGAPDCA